MNLTEPPKFQKIFLPDTEDSSEPPPPVVVKAQKKFQQFRPLEFFTKASSNPLRHDDWLLYHLVCAINTSREFLMTSKQDIWDGIYPQNPQAVPIYNPSGKYAVRLHVLGQWRQVFIDDRLPCKGEECILPRVKNKAEIWPMLLTKALLKALTITQTKADSGDEEVGKKMFPNILEREVYSFFVTCLTGMHPEFLETSESSFKQTLLNRMTAGKSYSVGWGNHPQERIKYISSFATGEGDEKSGGEGRHWDVNEDSSFIIHVNWTGELSHEVDIHAARLSWLLSTPAKEISQEGENQEETEEQREKGEQEVVKDEDAKISLKTEVMKPNVDMKHSCSWKSFLAHFTHVILFHKDSDYEFSSMVFLGQEVAAENSETPVDQEEHAIPVFDGLSHVALFVDNTKEDSDYVLFSISSSCQASMITISEIMFETKNNEMAEPSEQNFIPSITILPRTLVETDVNRSFLLRVRKGKSIFIIDFPSSFRTVLRVSSDSLLELKNFEGVFDKVGIKSLSSSGTVEGLEPRKDTIWFRQKLLPQGDCVCSLIIKTSNPHILSSVQLVLVDCSTREIFFSTKNQIDSVKLQASAEGYILIARSYFGASPLAVEGEEATPLTCSWSLAVLSSCEVTMEGLASDQVLDANGYFVPNYSNELFRYQIEPKDETGLVYFSVFLRSFSPAELRLSLIATRKDQVWHTHSRDEASNEEVKTIEKDGKLVTTPLLEAQDLNCCEIFEACIPPAEDIVYLLIAHLVARRPLVMMAPKTKAEGSIESAEEEAAVDEKNEEAAGERALDESAQEEGKERVEKGEAEYVTNDIEEPGQEPFWSLRILTSISPDGLISENTTKEEKIDAFTAECRTNQNQEAFVLAMRKQNKLPSSDDAAAPAEPQGTEAEEEGETTSWPPQKEEEQSWADYLKEYLVGCPPAEPLVKRDLEAAEGYPSHVQLSEDWKAQEEMEEREATELDAVWEAHRQSREENKQARESSLNLLMQDMSSATVESCNKWFSKEEGSFLESRSKLLDVIAKGGDFLKSLTEALATIEVVLIDVEDENSESPSQQVNYEDEEIVGELLLAVKEADEGKWNANLERLAGRDPPMIEMQDVSLHNILCYHRQKVTAMLQTEHKRISQQNAAESDRLKEAAAAAAAAAAAEESEEA
uniref:Calpain catalytic domain-containing protein n=1 Tax=Guillardia theta TaxID=55529 RepID=A0A7S4NSV2_GUITH